MSAEDLVRRWLGKNMTGCGFAALAAHDGLAVGRFETIAAPEAFDALFVAAASDKLPALAILEGVRTELQLAEQLLVLSTGGRWRVRRVAKPAIQTDDVFVGLAWQTGTAGLWSLPMGLAPLGTMPQTRRAPHTCIAAWTGDRANAFRTKKEEHVHLLDADLSRYETLDTRKKYTALRDTSVEDATAILHDDKASNYRNVAFRLSSAVAERLAALPLET